MERSKRALLNIIIAAVVSFALCSCYYEKAIIYTITDIIIQPPKYKESKKSNNGELNGEIN